MHADLAMYEAKQAGGAGWRIFGDTSTGRAGAGQAGVSAEAAGTRQR
jgi:hypothetical protein